MLLFIYEPRVTLYPDFMKMVCLVCWQNDLVNTSLWIIPSV